MEAPEVKAQRLLDTYYQMKLGVEDPTPDGFVSIQELMAASKCSRGQVFRMMARLEKKGKVERILLRKMINGRLNNVSYFR